jgi:ethanolamine utilization microcompartment shell protein EutL
VTSFTAPEVGPAGQTFTLTLVVVDGSGAASAAATVEVAVTNVNRAPLANAGLNQSVLERTRVALNGAASSDPDGDALAYLWTAPTGVVLSSTTAASPSFAAPSVGPPGQTLSFSLVVTDPSGASSAPSPVQVQVNNRGRRLPAATSQVAN